MGRFNALLAAMLVLSPLPAGAQSAAERQTLRSQIEERFDVLPVQGGVVLRPRDSASDVRAIDLTGGSIAIDGEPATGAELRQRLGADADLVIRLSYLDASEQRALFPTPPPAPAPPAPTPPAPPVAPAAPAPPTAAPPGPSDRNSDRVRFGGNVQVDADEIVRGDVVAIGGGARVEGRVTGDVVAIGGNLELGPKADVGGDVVVVGGALRRDPGARVGGSVQEVGFGSANLWPRGWWRGAFGMPRGFPFDSSFSSLFALLSTVTRMAILGILASIVLLFGRSYVEQIGLRAAAEPLKAGLVGVLIQILFVPVVITTIVLMVITIIGIPLLALVPFALVAFALLFLVGFTAVVYDLGRLAAERFGWPAQNPYVVAAIGIALTLSPVLVGRLIGFAGGAVWPVTWSLLLVGFLAEYAVWTVGLGAIALARFDRK